MGQDGTVDDFPVLVGVGADRGGPVSEVDRGLLGQGLLLGRYDLGGQVEVGEASYGGYDKGRQDAQDPLEQEMPLLLGRLTVSAPVRSHVRAV